MAPASRPHMMIALLAAVVLVSARAAWWFLRPADFAFAWGSAGLALGWLGTTLVLAHALWLLLQTGRAAAADSAGHGKESSANHGKEILAEGDSAVADPPMAAVDRILSPRRVAVAWALQVGLAAVVWPYALDPLANTAAALVFWSMPLLLPAALAESWPVTESCRRGLSVYARCMVGLFLAASVLAAGVYLQRSRPFIGGVDFFFFLCNARDMLADPQVVAPNAYRYFPGAYAFWRTVMWSEGGDLGGLQNAYVAVLIANGVLCSAVVFRLTRKMAAGVFAAVWYLVVCSRFQGLTGVVEPLATVPFLVGLLCWGGVPLRGVGGMLRAIALGAGLGGALLCKQQAGLLSLGAVWLLLSWRLVEPSRRHWLLALGLLPLTAASVLLVGILAEGRGWLPLQQALNMLTTYPAEGSWVRNLYVQLRGDESLAVVGLMVGLGVVAILFSAPRRRQLVGTPWLEVVGYCLVASVATLLQFRTRPYGHYMLLAVPALVVASVTLAVKTIPDYVRKGRFQPLRWGLLLVAAAVPLANTAGNPRTLHVWRLRLPADYYPQLLWHQQPRVAADLRRLRRHVQPGQTLYVLPPRHNAAHFLLQTRSPAPWGYSFQMPALNDVPAQRFDSVLVLSGGLDESDRRIWGQPQVDESATLLVREGYRPNMRLRTMTLFEPTKPAADAKP